MSSPYLTKSRLMLFAYAVPPDRFETLEMSYPGFLDAQIELVGTNIEDRLRHKYAVPFPENHPTIQGWMAAIIQLRAIARIGVDPNDVLYQEVKAQADLADTQITDAGDTKSSRWNLPLIAHGDPSAVSKGGPIGYSEASPYDCLDRQWEAVNG